MSEPWFQPDGLLRFRPLVWQGRAVLAATWITVIVFGLGGFFLTEAETPGWWVTGAIAFGAFLVGHAVVLWKMDWGYGRR
jgi:hypothetical protein